MTGLLQGLLVAGIAKDTLAANQHEIDKLNVQLAAMTDGDEATDLRTLKERKVNQGFCFSAECSSTRANTAIASGRVRTSRDAVPSDQVLRKLSHGHKSLAGT